MVTIRKTAEEVAEKIFKRHYTGFDVKAENIQRRFIKPNAEIIEAAAVIVSDARMRIAAAIRSDEE